MSVKKPKIVSPIISETIYKAIFENSLDAILVSDHDDCILSANPAACLMFGRTEKELMEIGRDEVLDISDKAIAELVKERKKTKGVKGEIKLLKKDGSSFLAEVSSFSFKTGSGNENIIRIIRNISGVRSIEESIRIYKKRFEVALDDLNIAVFNQDKDLRYTWIYKPQLGYQTSEVIGHKDHEFLPQEDAEEVVAIKQKVLDTGIPISKEVVVHSPDKPLIYKLIVDPLRDDSGTVWELQVLPLTLQKVKN
jgi:PAS domain S-box-containing protein